MNSRQRRLQRRQAQTRKMLRTLQETHATMRYDLANLRESTDHEILKLTASLARQTPLVAELQIALRHIAQAASIVGADPGPAAVSDVPSVNDLRLKVLAALKGPQ